MGPSVLLLLSQIALNAAGVIFAVIRMLLALREAYIEVGPHAVF